MRACRPLNSMRHRWLAKNGPSSTDHRDESRRLPTLDATPDRRPHRRVTDRGATPAARVGRTLRIGELTSWWIRLSTTSASTVDERRPSPVAEVHVPGQQIHRRRRPAPAIRCRHPPHEVHQLDVAAVERRPVLEVHRPADCLAEPAEQLPPRRRTPARSTVPGRGGHRAWRRAPMWPGPGGRTRRRRGRRPTPTRVRRPSAGRQARGPGRCGNRSRPTAPGRDRDRS